jgi:hypothetical protein
MEEAIDKRKMAAVSAVVSLVKIVDLILPCSNITTYSMYNVCYNFFFLLLFKRFWRTV